MKTLKYQLKQIITEIVYILNTELKQKTHYENDRISISHIPIINIFKVAEYRHLHSPQKSAKPIVLIF